MMNRIPQEVFDRYPALNECRSAMERALEEWIALYRRGGTLLVCGNGGSAADSEHIAGELLKGFLKKRPLNDAERAAFGKIAPGEGEVLAGKLQKGLRCLSLLSHPGFLSAFCNDVDPSLIFAQQLYAQGRKGDLLLGISTGGGAENVRNALIAARAMGITTMLLTGNRHGRCEEFADVVIAVPERETYRIQELHLPVYHALCAGVEREFFDR